MSEFFGVTSDQRSIDEFDFEDDAELYELVERLDASTVESFLTHPNGSAEQGTSDEYDESSPQNNIETLCLPEEIDSAKLDQNVVHKLDVTRSEAGESPYERFRARRKRLSVTDLVAPLWCNTQFQYNLELLAQGGRKRRTKAMKVGSKIHSTLEAAVHVTVEFKIDPERPEERLGLRLLNMIAGLSELMQSGITRELPVFGYLRDTLITGVIDELRLSKESNEPTSKESRIIAQFLGRQAPLENQVLTIGDTKTRVSRSSPSSNQVEQAKLQLSLYWILFSKLPEFPIEALLDIEKVDGHKTFSDVFISQAYDVVGDILDADFLTSPISHNVLFYWTLLVQSAQRLRGLLSNHMEITYIHQRSKETIAVTSFEHDETWMNDHLGPVFAWWSGNQAASGVSIEEAFKCRSCEFEYGCSWRLQKIADLSSTRERAKLQTAVKTR